jgi:RimJ/RimL family protein N-acetyltransferase
MGRMHPGDTVGTFSSPVIRSARLVLRPYGPGDEALALEVVVSGEPEALPPGAPAEPGPLGEWLRADDRRSWRDGGALHFMMLDSGRNKIVGSIGAFHPDWEVRSTELGYGVRSDERGQGFASEALAAVSRWLLTDGGLQRAWLTANTDNLASVRVAEKAGFQREGTLRRAGLEDDGLHDQAVFSLLDDELDRG